MQNLVEKELSVDEVSKLVEYGKGELEGYDKDGAWYRAQEGCAGLVKYLSPKE